MGGVHSRKEQFKQLSIAVRNIYLWACTWLPPVHVLHIIHEHTVTALGCRPNSTCKVDGLMLSWCLASPRVLNPVGITTMKTKVISILKYRSQDWRVSAANQTRASTVGGEARKELFEQLVNSYSEHLHIILRQYRNTVLYSFSMAVFWIRTLISNCTRCKRIYCVKWNDLKISGLGKMNLSAAISAWVGRSGPGQTKMSQSKKGKVKKINWEVLDVIFGGLAAGDFFCNLYC